MRRSFLEMLHNPVLPYKTVVSLTTKDIACLFQGMGRPATNRDGTSRCPFVPGQKKFPCPVVPLSRDKKVLPVPLSLCPGTMAGANVPGQTPLSRDVPGQNEF